MEKTTLILGVTGLICITLITLKEQETIKTLAEQGLLNEDKKK
jgi:hypothetical protein